MSLSSKYQNFLSSPTIDALAPGSSLHYLPSTTSITEPSAIVKHLKRQAEQVKTKHNIVNALESSSSICVEAETTLRFETGGGTYLPGLDDNFLADKIVTLPMVHLVAFDKDSRIHQVRLYWDQGALLKSLDVIGSRGKNWPIADSAKQVQILTSSADAAIAVGDAGRSGRQPSKAGPSMDKHTSLSLFAPRQYEREDSPANPVNPRSSLKPAPRDYYDLFSGGASADQLPANPESPNKEPRNPIKGGAGKNYQENRLFDADNEESAQVTSPEKKIDPTKYNHFEFGETAFQLDPTRSAKHDKHASQWNFEDLETPAKIRQRTLTHQERHFGWSDDEEEASKPLVHRPHVPQARPSTETHFEFNDVPTPKGPNRASKVPHVNNNMGLYQDHVVPTHEERAEEPVEAAGKHRENAPLSNVTNTNIRGHQKNFSSQIGMTDDSPSTADKVNNENKITEGRKKAARNMGANWDMQDESPDSHPKHRGIHIEGDGMGGRKVPGEKGWWEY